MRSDATATLAFALVASLASAQVPAGGEFLIGGYASGQWGPPRAAIEPDGDFVVVWSREDGSGTGVFGQRFRASGTPLSAAFQVNTYTTGDQADPDVSVGSNGDFVVAWARQAYGYSENIHARRYDGSGNALGDEFQVSANAATYDGPHVGRASDGRFVVSWVGIDDYGVGMLARRYAASGTPVGGEFVLNPTMTNAEYGGDVAVEGNGSFVAVWETYPGTLRGQRYDAAGSRIGSEFQVNSNTSALQHWPRVSVAAGGGFVVVWTGVGNGNQLDTFARRFDASGTALGNDFLVNTTTMDSQIPHQVAHDDQGNFVVTWTTISSPGVAHRAFGQRFSATGARRGAEFPIGSGPDNQGWASISSDPVGNLVVAWGAFPLGGPARILGQRFGGLQPAALAVDTAGNGVLEPGETVDARPSWLNINGAPQTVSATLHDITGPAGAAYAIVDGTGDYATIAIATASPCIDCYGLSVSDPATRPSVHWDASVVESILPDAQGQQQQWLIHVGESFADVPSSSGFYPFVETLLHRGVTGGCSPGGYCPGASTTREQMAVFVIVARDRTGFVPPACTTPVFVDVPASSPFCPWIEELARRGIASGCAGGHYCPGSAVSREQMAVFVLRALDPTVNPPSCTTPIYADVPSSSPFCRWIEELTRRNVVAGCGGGSYCPAAPVTREQMSVFLSVTFGLALYGP